MFGPRWVEKNADTLHVVQGYHSFLVPLMESPAGTLGNGFKLALLRGGRLAVVMSA